MIKYKIKIKDIQPVSYSVARIFPANCFLGISLSNPFFQGKHLEKVIRWIDDNFSECRIIIADHLHRFNEYTFKGIVGVEAEADCIKIGEEIHSKIKNLIKTYDNSKFEINHWLSFTKLDEFQKNSDFINTYFENNIAFKESVLKSCEEFIERQIGRGYILNVTKEKAIDFSKKYVLEEMAVFSILISKGYPIQVYPGSQLRVLKEIVNNKFPDFTGYLKDAIYIDLTIKKI